VHTPLGPEPLDGHLRQVNAVTIGDYVPDPSVASFVMIVSSMCPHCKDFKPLVKVVSDLLDPITTRFVWMNGPKNDIPNFLPEYSSYPLLFMWPWGQADGPPITYGSRPRSVEAMLDWIAENAEIPGFEIPVYDKVASAELVKKLTDEEYKHWGID
jgi:hypothetical protein